MFKILVRYASERPFRTNRSATVSWIERWEKTPRSDRVTTPVSLERFVNLSWTNKSTTLTSTNTEKTLGFLLVPHSSLYIGK